MYSLLRSYNRMKEARALKARSVRRSRAGRFDIEPSTKECRSSGRSLSPDGSSVPLCPASAYTHTRMPSHAHSRKRPLCADAGHNAVARAISGHSSPFSVSHEWHGNRLSITHAHSRDRDTWRERTPSSVVESRSECVRWCAHDGRRWGEAAAGRNAASVCCCTCLHLRSRGRGCEAAAATFAFSPSKERPLLRFAWPTAETTWPTTRARATFRIRRVSHVRQVIKWHNGAPEGPPHRGLRAFWQNLLLRLNLIEREKEIDRGDLSLIRSRHLLRI